MAQIIELNDDDLEKVTGGGGQAMEGIYGEPYTSIEVGRYYCNKQNPKDGVKILYVTELMTGRFCCSGRREILHIDAENNWYTEFILNDSYTAAEMKAGYQYVLNIRV